jgi:hypothetical protein
MAADRPEACGARLEGQGLRVSVSPSGGETTVEAQEAHPSLWTGVSVRLGDRVGSPPEDLAFQHWETRVDADGVTATIAWQSLWIEKRLCLATDAPRLEIEYAFLNTAPIFVRPAFGLRLLLPTHPDVAWHVPAEGGVRSERFAGSSVRKRYLWPAAPWCGISLGGNGVAALFPEGVLDAVEIRTEGRHGLHSLTPLVYYLGLSPGCEARVTCALAFGVPLHDGIAPLLAAPTKPLRADYEPAPAERRSRAEEMARKSDAAPSINTEAVRTCRTLRERAEQLRAGRKERLELLSRLEEGEVSVEEALAHLQRSGGVRQGETHEA